MAGNITHAKVSIMADDPNYDILPSDWNANHVIPASVPNVTPTAAGDHLNGKADGTWEKKTLAEEKTLLGVNTKYIRGSISNPQAMYAQAPQIVLIDATESAITITGIYIKLNDTTPGAELAGDLKFADDQVDGSFANAAVIDVCDTTNGVFTATSGFDDATVPSGKAVYYQMDASPHADIKRFTIKVTYTVD